MARTRLIFPLLLLIWACTPSAVVKNQFVTYNFKDEGYLSPALIQTLGQSGYAEGEQTVQASRVHCLSRAEDAARKKLLRVLLHTRFDLKAQAKSERDSFDRDYPAALTDRDLLRAEVDFAELLSRSFVAVKDARSNERCSVVLRLPGQDLPGEVRAMPVTFRLERKK